MKKIILASALIFIHFLSFSQAPVRKTFWKEDFSSGKLPAGWQNISLNDSSPAWSVTDQPYPGSPGKNQQAPPIASGSGGYHLQLSVGTKTGKNVKKWNDASVYPESYVQSAPINCSGKNSVVLTFEQNFSWAEHLSDKNNGLLVGVSNNGTDWTDYDVRYSVPSDEDCPNPMDVELNITRVAARQNTVYVRFYWSGIYRWYWMIDDIALSEAYDADLQVSALTSHPVNGNAFTKKEEIVFHVVNLGSSSLTRSFDCYLKIDKRPVLKTTIVADEKNSIAIIDTVHVKFPGIDLSDLGIHKINFFVDLPEDVRRSNDSLRAIIYAGAYELGPVDSISNTGNEYEFSCGYARIKLQFLRKDIFRIWMAYDGEFQNPAGNDIVMASPWEKTEVLYSESEEYYLFKTDEIALRAFKKPLRFALYKKDGQSIIWEELRPITYGAQTIQYLTRRDDEYFYGGGMQNGRFSHRGSVIKLDIDYNWSDGGNPNPAPFFMSTCGYGALRNTYSPGEYSFKENPVLSHQETRFDCYYFTGSSLKDILGDYTDITGKPFLMPRWALSMGDANCYNRGASANADTVGSTASGHSGLTPDVINIIADQYIAHNMPRGWILPNDGYGCGYTKLDSVVKELHKRGFHTGLWTENGLDRIAREVGEYGSRLCKLDVAWVGPGYKFAIDGAKAAYEGIENNSDARGFVWTVCGWAGSHRNAVLWTGDESGSWDYIRWHIPTVIGSGLSAQNCTTGDVDGIFGGGDSTYVRDLQWKCFTPVFMIMSGWATNNKNHIVDKQPWLYGEPFTSINRKYLMMKQRYTPYMYTLCAEANRTGVPAVRALVLEYPDDPVTFGTQTQYEFLLGRDLLVAPVFEPEGRRDSIYLPGGKWFDYWNGAFYKGGTWLTDYPAPLDKLPLFVKAGAILPSYMQMMYDWERPADTLQLEIFPEGNSSYELYEDDGLTRGHRDGVFATTRFEVVENHGKDGSIAIKLNASEGEFTGRLKQRTYILLIHTKKVPRQLTENGKKLKRFNNNREYNKPGSGWYYNKEYRQGTIFVKTDILSTDMATKILVR